MGREVKRVPLNFNWPLNIVWPGYCLGVCEELMKSYFDNVPNRKELGFTEEKAEEWTDLFYTLVQGKEEIPIGINPPKGEGYQVWETVSEGSPVTPVFAAPEELARWLCANDRSITRDTSYDGWVRFIKEEGSAPSMVSRVNSGQLQSLDSGVKAQTDS